MHAVTADLLLVAAFPTIFRFQFLSLGVESNYCVRIRCDTIFTTIDGVKSKILKLCYMSTEFCYDGLRRHSPAFETVVIRELL